MNKQAGQQLTYPGARYPAGRIMHLEASLKQGHAGIGPSLDDSTDVETHSQLSGRGSQGLFG